MLVHVLVVLVLALEYVGRLLFLALLADEVKVGIGQLAQLLLGRQQLVEERIVGLFLDFRRICLVHLVSYVLLFDTLKLE